MLCVKRRLSKRGNYYVVYVTKLVRNEYIEAGKLYNIYVFSDIDRTKLVFFDTRKITEDNNRYYIRLFTTRKNPFFFKSNVILCIEDITKYRR